MNKSVQKTTKKAVQTVSWRNRQSLEGNPHIEYSVRDFRSQAPLDKSVKDELV